MSEPALSPTEVPPPPRSREATRQTWAERLARFAAAGLTTAQFCAAEGISVASFYHWKRRFPATGPAEVPDNAASAVGPRLLPVRLPAPTSAIELVLPGGAVLRIGPGTDAATLGPLLRLLGVLPC